MFTSSDYAAYRLDRILHRVTPILVSLVLIITLLLLGATQHQLQEQAERAELRGEHMIEMLEEGRDQWGPALEHISERVDEICAVLEDC